ncbi:glutathione S-transferase N-terminal domain-containing protein [Pseudomonas sp. 5P_3.1_Bac2]|uniref:glutathione S-transferase n=1 Tax=Pseudomonas sp. 5P_3.1_Bac2 TaxID=2971617 RepID=UPI0021C5AF59|nr:glutathione S-transferase N-terminal domain-containing protein [Pseudomonas sp. 5P_3.1_Bac2]MCU1717795.1 glutathione S-transferase N-terminal domain-containing protein [Pseudomonas sp. 5P_3.1_Bac2]
MAVTMTLLYSPLSPFARKVLVLLHATGQTDRVKLQLVQPAPTQPVAELNANNPAGKIPALILADGSVLHDSRVILDYLDQQHSGTPLIPRSGPQRWQRLTLASLADAIMDAAVLMRYESFLRPEALRWDVWLDGQGQKIERALQQFEHLATGAELSQQLDIATIGLGCALGYLDLRQPDLAWRQRHPALADWYAGFSQQPALLATQPQA